MPLLPIAKLVTKDQTEARVHPLATVLAAKYHLKSKKCEERAARHLLKKALYEAKLAGAKVKVSRIDLEEEEEEMEESLKEEIDDRSRTEMMSILRWNKEQKETSLARKSRYYQMMIARHEREALRWMEKARSYELSRESIMSKMRRISP